MIIKILKGDSIEGPLQYNFSKESREVAEIIGCNNIMTDGNPTLEKARNAITSCASKNKVCKRPIFTVSINPAPEDLEKISDTDFVDMAYEYMDRMGYGAQPYVIFKHSDIERTHIHIVSVRVTTDGGIINDKYEQKHTSEIRRDLEKKYGLAVAEDRKKNRKESAAMLENKQDRVLSILDDALSVTSDKRRYMRMAVRDAVEYNCTNLKELNKALHQWRVEAEIVNEGTRREGILFYALKDDGTRDSTPMKGSSVSSELSAPKIRAIFESNASRTVEKSRVEPMREAIDHWMAEAESLEELTELLRGEGIEAQWLARDSGEVVGVTFIDKLGKVILNGSDLGRQYSYASIKKQLEANALKEKGESRVTADDYKLIFDECQSLYREKRKDIGTYYYESQLLESLQELRGDFFSKIDNDERFTHYSQAAKMRAVDSFLDFKRKGRKRVVEKENDYFSNVTKKFVPYIAFLERGERTGYLEALNLGYKNGCIYSLKDERVCLPLTEYKLADSTIPEQSEGKRVWPLKKEDRETLKKIIESGVGELQFKEYRPYHPLLKMLSKKDRTDFIKRQISCEAERTFEGTGAVSDCVTELLEKGFLVVPVVTESGKKTYAVKDYQNTETSQMVVVSDEIRDRLERTGYRDGLMKQVAETVYNRYGGINPEYRAVVSISRAYHIEDEKERDRKMERALKWLDGYDSQMADRMRQKYAAGATAANIASELQGKKLRRKNK